MQEIHYNVGFDDIDFAAVYNRNELIVRTELKKLLEEEGVSLSAKDIQDIYALTLNDFSPHYVHKGTIVLVPNIKRPEVLHQLKRNLHFVQTKPKV